MKKITETELGTAEFIGDFEAGSEEWHNLRSHGIGGSEIGTIMGLNPYESAYTLWHKKKGLIQDSVSDDNIAVFIGKSMETPILERYEAQHPELEIFTTGTWRHKDCNWMHANPDAIYRNKNTGAWGIIEIKTGRNPWPELPPGYHAQVMWYLEVFGFQHGKVIAIAGYNWEEYDIEYDHFVSSIAKASAERFMHHYETDIKPDWDGSMSTYETVRELHPDIDDTEVDVGELGVVLWNAQKKLDEAQRELNKAKSATLDAMGRAKHAVTDYEGDVFRVATRQARRDGLPYLVVKK